MALTEVQVPYRKDYDLGIGVDLATGSPMGKVVDGVVAGNTNATGSKTAFQITRIDSTEDLQKSLGISVEASGGFGCFGASARMDFAKSSKVQTSSLFMAITAAVELEHIFIPDASLTAQADALASRTDVFAARYGNMFVRGVTRGGVFVAVMRIDVQNSEEASSLALDLSGGYGMFSAEAETHMSELQKKYHEEIYIMVYHEGGPIDLVMEKLTDPQQFYTMLQAWLKAFQEHPNENSVPYYVTLAPIAIANGPIPPNAAQLQHADDVLKICARERNQILDGMNLMEYISQNASRYDFPAPTTVADIVKALDGYQSDLSVASDAASQTLNDPEKAITPAEYAAQNHKAYPQGVPPMPMPTAKKAGLDVLAAKGAMLASQDPMATELRNRQPEGAARRGFDIGMGVAEGQSLPGPGKQRIHDSLDPDEQDGYTAAVEYSLARNRNLSLAMAGAAIANANPVVAKARTAYPSVFYWLGFDIASGIFGDPKLGALGNTASGPGSLGIRDALTAPYAKDGFNASMKLHLGPPALPRQA